MGIHNRTWGAVVIRRNQMFYARTPNESLTEPTPDWAQINLVRVVQAAGTSWFPRFGEGTVLWWVDGTVPSTREMVDLLREQGCQVTDTGHATGWFTVRHGSRATVHLGIVSMLAMSSFSVASFGAHPAEVAHDLVRYAELTGAAWRGAPGMNGTAQIRALHEGRLSGQPLWRWSTARECEGVKCSFELRGATDRRRMTEQEREHYRWVYQFDVRAMYLAGANVAELGWSSPEHRGPQEFDPTRPGYWCLRRDELGGVSRQLVRSGEKPLVWVTTPVLRYLKELGYDPEVMDSWTSERCGRYLKAWAERLTHALRAVPPAPAPGQPSLEKGLKDTYKQTIGFLARDAGRIYRPDWRDIVVDTARVNALRKCASVRPLRWNVDSVWIATDVSVESMGRAIGVPYEPNGAEVWQIGKFRRVNQMTPEEYIARYERSSLPA